MRVIQCGVIADQPRIHFPQHAGANYRIEIEGSDVNGDDQHCEHGEDPTANPPATSSRTRLWFRVDRSTRGIECRSHLDVLFVLLEKQDRYRRIEARYLALPIALRAISVGKSTADRHTA